MTPTPTITRRIADGFIVVLLLLAPVKFGSLWDTGEIPTYPLDIWEWLFAAWPPVLMSGLCGFALLLSVLAHPIPERRRTHPLLRPDVLILLLLAASLPGLVRTTSWYEAQLFLWHLAGAACLALAVHIVVRHDPRRFWMFACAIALAGGWVVLQGWRQVPGGGIEATLDMARQMARDNGRELPSAFVSRLEGKRAFGSFFLPNSYAAHLLLAGPVLMVSAWLLVLRSSSRVVRSGSCVLGPASDPGSGGPAADARPRGVRLAGGVAVLLVAALWAGSLYFSKSRAALVAGMVCGAAAFVVVLPGRRRRLLAGAVCLALGLGFFMLVHQGRSFSSLEARSQYWSAALRMTREAPVMGKGLYEFFPHYMRYKSAESEETRLPHSALLAFSSQSGVFAAAVFAGLAVCGVRNFLRGLRRPYVLPGLVRSACASGFLAWWVHSLTDVNLHIPGSLATAWVLLVLSFDESDGCVCADAGCGRLAGRWVFVLLAVVVVGGCWRLPAQRLFREMVLAPRVPEALPFLARGVERVGRLDPFTPYPWEYAGKEAQALQRHGLAARFFSAASARAAHRSSYWFRLAECRLALGDVEGARSAFALAREWHPAAARHSELAERLEGR